MAEKRVKSHQLTVRLEPRIYDDLVEVGLRMGVKPAVLAGVAIGEYTSKAKTAFESTSKMQETMMTEMAKNLSEHLAQFLTEEQMQKMMLEQG
jgi:hypothetical protein